MMNVKINYISKIDEITDQYKEFKFIKNIKSLNNSNIVWNRSEGQSHDIQVMFIGKTGYGKSTTLNSILGKNFFETDDIQACTKFLYCADFKLNLNQNAYLSFCDLPGIGEARQADEEYYKWYKNMLKKSHCVVYLLRADQRDFSLDVTLFESMFTIEEERKKVIIGLNYSDKIEPINRNSLNISSEQLKNLQEKVNNISKIFKVDASNIIFYSAKSNYNINSLIEKIAKVLNENL